MSGTERTKKRRILILSHFFGTNLAWIDDFCHREDLEFTKVPYLSTPVSWHQRGRITPVAEWLQRLKYVRRALKQDADCVIACFPQMALPAALLLRVTGNSTTRLVAWHFNLGSLTPSWKGWLAGRILARVDRFVVHASDEIRSYARWLRLPQERFRFIPFQRGRVEATGPSPIPKPYIVSMGSANRDYSTLTSAVLGAGIKTVIISKRDIVEKLPEHPDLIKLHSLTMDECNSILRDAAINVIPISDSGTASGQVTFLTGMRMGVPTVSSRCVGTVDYFQDGKTGLLVPPSNVDALRTAIRALWDDSDLRSRIAMAGYQHAERYFSDEAAGEYLAELLGEVLA
jgi:glycosyltransferase involved in cell wall biosynthesis